ncbi:unnamed protein product [Rotaria sordida]|uniref:AP-3 complex subunit delta domain-containing protein n=1 Tax=Rotaria sordida TaxID=392033 RepID=A0A819J664_9BILA|nr:unnamed protein product [Rotaria sordida]
MYPQITKYFKKTSNLDPLLKEIQVISSWSTTLPSLTSSSTLSTTPATPVLSLTSSSSASSIQLNMSENDNVTSEVLILCTNDIGLWIGKRLTDEQKYELITNHFKPDKGFVWPYKERKVVKNGKSIVQKRYLKQSHLDEFKWLRYSQFHKGLYCIACCLFATSVTGVSSFGKLVEKPLNDYKYLLGNNGDLLLDQNKQYHSDSIAKMNNFIYIYSKKPEASIEQNIALHGHRDDGNTIIESEASLANEGNFCALLLYRIQSGDEVLKKHLERCNKNATYISKTTQNQLIDIIGKLILKQVIEEVKQAQFFTILLDETTDIANIEQASLCIRYILNDQIHERFLMFIPVMDRSGAGLADLIITSILDLGLDLAFCVGQGYDDCSAMSGHIKGCQAIIRDKYPHILYVHCASHSFNLAISDSCEIRSIQNTIGTIKEIYNFIRSLSVRSEIFERLAREINKKRVIVLSENNETSSIQSLENSTSEVRYTKVKLVNVCATRWVERHIAVETFNCLFPVVVELLTNLMKSKDKESSIRSNLFYGAISSSEFLCSLPMLNKLLSFTVNVARSLQNNKIDLMNCISNIEDILQVMQMMRNEPDEEYNYLFQEAQDLGKYTETVIEMPRITKRQINRDNIPASSAYDYFKLNIFIPLLDHFLVAIKDRFSEHVKKAAAISCLVPKYIVDKSYDDLAPAIEIYNNFLSAGSDVQVKSEFLLWKKRWMNIVTETISTPLSPSSSSNTTTIKMKQKQEIVLPDTAIDAYAACPEAFYPNIKILLKIFATLPVTTATTERTFSVLKFLKTYLRSTMSETRLNGLAMMYIYRDVDVNVDAVIDEFAKSNRRLKKSDTIVIDDNDDNIYPTAEVTRDGELPEGATESGIEDNDHDVIVGKNKKYDPHRALNIDLNEKSIQSIPTTLPLTSQLKEPASKQVETSPVLTEKSKKSKKKKIIEKQE